MGHLAQRQHGDSDRSHCRAGLRGSFLHTLGYLGGEILLATLGANPCGHALQDEELAVIAIVDALQALFHLTPTIDAVVIGLHGRLLSVGLFHLGIVGIYTVISTSHPERFRPHTT